MGTAGLTGAWSVSSWRKRAPALLIAVALSFGLFVSFRYSLGLWRADPDVSVPYVLWHGVQRHGPGFLATWTYSPDNWLLTLAPMTWVAFALAGTAPRLIIVIGWLIFVASVALTAQLTRRIAGTWAAALLACTLIFASFQALGAAGFLSYPVTHNSSMLWALAALLLAHHALDRASLLAAVLASICVLLDALSDPWSAAAIALPLMLASAGVAVFNRRSAQGRLSAILCALSVLAFWAARARLFGVLGFLPESPFVPTNVDGVTANTGWAFRALATMANIVPRGNPDSGLVVAFDGVVLAVLLSVAMVLTGLSLPKRTPAQQLVLAVSIVSIGGVLSAFLIGRWPPGLFIGRFFPNVFFLGGLLVAVAAADGWKRWPRAAKAAVLGYAALFALAGLASYPRLWTLQVPGRDEADIRAMGDFLAGNGLTYGYGPYWGSNALAMDWVTAGRVVIRPVGFGGGQVARRPFETSSLWYRAEDEPKTSQERFLVIVNDGEECPSVPACVAMATRQFGPPSRQLPYGQAVILVWPHSLADKVGK